MKRKTKLLSLLLSICMCISIMGGVATAAEAPPDEASSDETPSGAAVRAEDSFAEEFVVPDIVDEAERIEYGYVGRVKDAEQDLHTFVFRNEDGTNTMRVYSHPVKYVTADGLVRDISLAVKAKSDGGFMTADHEIVTTFERKLSGGISLAYHDVAVTLLPDVAEAASPVAALSGDGKVVTYGADDTTSFVYELTYTGFKEDIVVSEYTGQTEYAFTLCTNGLTLSERYGSFYLVDAENNVKATIGDIIVFTADERNNTMGRMSFETVRENREYKLTIHLDEDYLADEKTVYPIRIDPSIEVNYDNDGAGAIEDVTINSLQGSDGSSSSLFVGYREKYGVSHTLMKFPNLDLSAIANEDCILSATVQLRDVLCEGEAMTVYCCPFLGNEWTESTANWSNTNPPGFSGYLSKQTVSYANGLNQNPAHRYSFDITGAVKGWKSNTYVQNKGIIFRMDPMAEDDEILGHKTFASYNRGGNKPSLTVEYDPSGTSISNANAISLNTPVQVASSASQDVHYFKFVPSTPGFYVIESTTGGGDPFVRLYNAAGEELAVKNDGGVGVNFRLTYHMAEYQTYYIAAGTYNMRYGSYTMRIKPETSTTNFSKTFISFSSKPTTSVSVGAKYTCYSLQVDQAGEYLFYSSNATGDPKVWLYDSSMSHINSNDDSAGNKNFRLTATLTAGKTYYLVAGHFGINTGSYSLNLLRSADVASAYSYLKNIGTSKYMDIDGPGAQQQVHQWERHDGLQERWRIEKQTDGYYTIRSEYDLKKYVGAENTSVGVDNINLYTDISNKTKWKIYTTYAGELLLEPKSAPGKVVCAPNNSNNTELQLSFMGVSDSNSYRNKWNILTKNVYVEFSYDQGYIDLNRTGVENTSATRLRIQQNITDEFFPFVANAFEQQCGIHLTISSISNYTSDADNCPNKGLAVHCDCINEADCLLQYDHNPNSNNSIAGFSCGVHCKSITRLRNNLITGIPDNTIRITYSGHVLCFYSPADHNYNTVGLSDYIYPIICMNVEQANEKRSILVMAHELSHTYGIQHHSPVAGQPCIMDSNRYTKNNPYDPSTYWCDDCINTIVSNMNKY